MPVIYLTDAQHDDLLAIGWGPPGRVPEERDIALRDLVLLSKKLTPPPIVFQRLDGKAWLIDGRRYEEVPVGVEVLYEAARAARLRAEPPKWWTFSTASADAVRKAVHRDAVRWAKRKRCFGLVPALKAVSVDRKRGHVAFDHLRPGVPLLDLGI